MVDKYLLPFTGNEVKAIIDGRYHSPIQDVVGNDYTTISRLSLGAGVSEPFVCNGNIRNMKILPSHITNMWNTITNIATFPDFYNTPEIVANVSFMLDPSVSSTGVVTISVYVDETSPVLIKSTNVTFKGDTEKITALLTFYAGEEAGFDVKNKGVYFTVESSATAELYDPAIEFYRT